LVPGTDLSMTSQSSTKEPHGLKFFESMKLSNDKGNLLWSINTKTVRITFLFLQNILKK